MDMFWSLNFEVWHYGLFCTDVLRPLDLVPLTDFTYKYHPDLCPLECSLVIMTFII